MSLFRPKAVGDYMADTRPTLGSFFGKSIPSAVVNRNSLLDYVASQPNQPTISAVNPTLRDKAEKGLAGILAKVLPENQARHLASDMLNTGSMFAPVDPMSAQESVRDSRSASAQGRPFAAMGNRTLAALMMVPVGGSIGKLGKAAVREGESTLGKIIRAYHGSPHDFDRFDMSKIGTGEGAQAYGHGLYFAGDEETAQTYRKTLSGPSTSAPDRISPELRDALKAEDYLGFDSVGEAVSAMRHHGDWKQRWETDNTGRLEQAFEAYERQRYAGQGRMYEVNINANLDDLLDWERPLSEQSEKVRGGLDQALGNLNIHPSIAPGPDTPGSVVYGSHLKSGNLPIGSPYAGLGGARAPKLLQDAGIPGIKYKDQLSRGAEGGTNNYVIFNDTLIDILRKYGIGAAAAGGLGYGLTNPAPAEAKR